VADCWVFVEFLRTSIFQKGSGSTITTQDGNAKLAALVETNSMAGRNIVKPTVLVSKKIELVEDIAWNCLKKFHETG